MARARVVSTRETVRCVVRVCALRRKNQSVSGVRLIKQSKHATSQTTLGPPRPVPKRIKRIKILGGSREICNTAPLLPPQPSHPSSLLVLGRCKCIYFIHSYTCVYTYTFHTLVIHIVYVYPAESRSQPIIHCIYILYTVYIHIHSYTWLYTMYMYMYYVVCDMYVI